MADVKITQLPAALSVNDTDNMILDDGSSTYRVAADLLKEYISSAAVAAVNKNLAPAYNASSTYAVGDLCTYSGKLYKCIVAVTSPEAFNIIKWENVTTSETYATKGEIIGQITITENDRSDTYAHLYERLFNALSFTFNPEKTYMLIRYPADKSASTYQVCNWASQNTFNFNTLGYSGASNHNVMEFIQVGATSIYYHTAIAHDGTVTFTNKSNDTVTYSAGYKLLIVAI